MIEGIRIELDLDAVIRAVKAYQGSHEVDLDDLLTNEFFAKHTKYKSLTDLMLTAGLAVDDLDSPKLDGFIKINTKFLDLNDMLKVAATDYFIRRMGIEPITNKKKAILTP